MILARQAAVAVGFVVFTACSFGSPSTFTVSNASVDPSYTCPAGANNVHYDVRGTMLSTVSIPVQPERRPWRHLAGRPWRLILDESFTRYEGAGRTGFGIAERARR